MKTLFIQPYMKSTSAVTITKDEIAEYVDPRCVKSLLVFVDGKYCPQNSCVEGLPPEVTLAPIGSLTAGTRSDIAPNILFIADKGELSRNSFGSDGLAALNLVRIVRTMTAGANQQKECR